MSHTRKGHTSLSSPPGKGVGVFSRPQGVPLPLQLRVSTLPPTLTVLSLERWAKGVLMEGTVMEGSAWIPTPPNPLRTLNSPRYAGSERGAGAVSRVVTSVFRMCPAKQKVSLAMMVRRVVKVRVEAKSRVTFPATTITGIPPQAKLG